FLRRAERAEGNGWTPCRARCCPGLRCGRWYIERPELDQLGGVRQEEITHDHHRVAPFLREVESLQRQVGGFLRRRWRQHDETVVAVATAACCLEVITLAAAHVDDHHRNLRICQLGKALLHQADALACRRRHGSHAAPGRAPHHADGLDLAL